MQRKMSEMKKIGSQKCCVESKSTVTELGSWGEALDREIQQWGSGLGVKPQKVFIDVDPQE